MDQHHPSFPNPTTTRFPPPFFPPPNLHHNNHHHHHHLPPPPRLPPPPPQHLPHQSPISLPPPPPLPNSFHHHHHYHHDSHNSPQFANPHRNRHQQPIDPNLINRNHNYDYLQAPPRVTDRLVYDDDLRSRPPPQSHGFDGDPYRRQISGPVVWDPPPRDPIDAPFPPQPPVRRIPRGGYDREHPPYRPSLQPIDRFRKEQDGGSRVRKEGHSDVWFRVEDFPRERRDDRFDRREEFVSTKVEQFCGSLPQEEIIRKGRGDGNLRREHLPRGVPNSPTELRNRTIDGFYEENHVLETERYGDRDRWDDAQDYNLTPRKKQKKKNALLRIQPPIPSFRNSYERSPGLCKDRETSQLPDHRVAKEGRERSPIVSFQSNLLIVASSSSGAVADEKSALGDGKNWNEIVENKDDLVLPNNVVEKVRSKTDSDNHCENGPCTLENKPKPSTNLEKVKPSVSHDLPVGNSVAPSHKIPHLSEDNKQSKSPKGKVVLKFNVVSGSSKQGLSSLRKKRKITNPHSSLSSSQMLQKGLDSVSVDNFVNSLSSKSILDEGLKDSGKDLISAVKVTKPENVLTAPHTKDTAVGSSKASVEKCTHDSVSAGSSVPKTKRRKKTKSSSCSLGQVSGITDKIPVDVIGPTKKVGRTTNFDVISLLPQHGVSAVKHKKVNITGIVKEAAALSVEGCTNVLSAPDSMTSSERRLTSSRNGGSDSASSSDGVSGAKHKKFILAGIVKEASPNQTSASLEDGEIDQSMNAKPLEQDNKSTEVSSSEGFCNSEMSGVPSFKVPITLADNVVPENSGMLINGSDANTVNDDLSKPLSLSTEAGVRGGFPELGTLEGTLSLFPAEGSLTKNDRKRKASELHRGTRKVHADGVTLDWSIDPHIFQDKVTGSGFTCPDAQLHLRIGDCISMNGSEAKLSSLEAKVSDKRHADAYPSEVITSTCNQKNTVLAPEFGSAQGSTGICENFPYSNAVPKSSVEVEAPVSEFAHQSDLAYYSEGMDLNCHNDARAQASVDKLVEQTCGKGSSNVVLPETVNVSVIPDEKQISSFLDSVRVLQGDGTFLMGRANSVGIESRSEISIYNGSAAGNCNSQNQCTDQNIGHPEPTIVNVDHEPLIRDMECDINIHVKGDLSFGSEHLSLFTQSTSDDRVTSSSPMDYLSLVKSPENLSATTRLEMFDAPKLNGNPDGKRFSAHKKSNGKSTAEASFLSSFSNSSTPNKGTAYSCGKTMSNIPASQSAKEVLLTSKNERKKQRTGVIASLKAPSSRSSFVPSSGRRHTTAIKSRTWHRTDGPIPNLPGQSSSVGFVPRQMQTSSQIVRAQSNSYVRKGNSLLRNPATAVSQAPKPSSAVSAVCQALITSAPVTTVSQAPKTSAPETAVSQAPRTSAPTPSVFQLNLSASDEAKNTPCVMPEIVSSPCNIDPLNCNLDPVGTSRCSPVADSSMSTDNGSQTFPDKPKSSGNSELEMSKRLEDQGSPSHSNQATSYTRRMIYIKHKSNQLVAAPNSSSEISVSNKDLPALMSDIYFKRKKNQLVRATSETPTGDCFSSGVRSFKSYVSRSATKKDPNRVSLRIPKSRKVSLVWKLCNTRSPKRGFNSLRCQQVLPHLLPWKRTTYRRSLFRTSADLLKNSPLSHKLLSTRKTHIIYKRSGFSLRRSKVVSLAGSSLKWSISLEKRSKKVDKEAKFAAVALSEKEERDKNCFSDIVSGIKSTDNLLHEKQPSSGTENQVKSALKPSIPRRRLIGNDEYVRIGNGNQLVRNPKRRTRILASEKVRWSLHTARMRLAKKRKYCQFFTRFGKCNKEEGKCPYIHDPSKNAVCTKFLNGLCSDPECKLTHKVIPERMPDCSFFLQGLCSNESCPYRHVSVNPKADICGSFLVGYCAEGNECRKKHSYICPQYESTGECAEGSKCKLYHPKKGKDKNKKNNKDRKNTRGRYFGSRPATGKAETETEVYRKRLLPKDEGMTLEDGTLADFISLDVSDEEDGDQEEDETCDKPNLSEGVEPSLVFDDPDDLIKPIRLLQMMSQAAEGMA